MTTSASMAVRRASTTWQRPMCGATRAEAVFAGRGDLRPQWMRVAEIRHLGEIAAARGGRPALDARQRAIARRHQAALPTELLQPVTAQIVRASLEQRDTRRHADGAGHQRQVLVEQLVLQRARARGNEYAFARQQRRHQVGESLAGAGAGFDHQRRAVSSARAMRRPWRAANAAACNRAANASAGRVARTLRRDPAPRQASATGAGCRGSNP